ncbi:MAG: ABC transporter substrate-binding protein [Actinobacteria bacterium]|nr:ABC transporter substrate-binding protein [Actinomycetota bacterium]
MKDVNGEGRITRRDFLKIAGVAGAAVGLGAGMGGLLAACGGEATETTASTAGVTTTAGTPTTAGATTTVSATAQTGREVKLGLVTPQTGPLASFGVADKYCLDVFTKTIGDGVVLGDGAKHPITVTLVDSQSNSNRSAQVAGDLILNTKVDMLMAASSGDNTTPVADQAEANGVPCISTDTPWQAWYNRGGKAPEGGYKWTYHAFWGQEDNFGVQFDMWTQVPTNKVVGVVWPNDVDGNNYRANWPKPLANAGYKTIDGGSFQDGLEDFTDIITKFKEGGAEIVSGVMSPPDFTNFWKQSKQQSFNPKINEVGKALLFPQSVDAIGPIADGLATTIWWHPTYPFKSPLTNQTCQEFADAYETTSGKQWTQPLLHFLLFEWAIDVLKRVKNIDDKEETIQAVSTTKVDTIDGPIDFTQEVGATGGTRPVPNVVRLPLAGGQWVTGTKFPFDLVICDNKGWSMIPVSTTLKPLTA